MSRVRISSSAPVHLRSRTVVEVASEREPRHPAPSQGGDPRGRRPASPSGVSRLGRERASHLNQRSRVTHVKLAISGVVGDSGETDSSSHAGVCSMSRTRKIALGALVVLLAAAPFVPARVTTRRAPSRPRRQARQAPLATSGTRRLSAGSRRRCAPRSTGSSPPAARSAGCAWTPRPTPAAWPTTWSGAPTFEGQRYCLAPAGPTAPRPTSRPGSPRPPAPLALRRRRRRRVDRRPRRLLATLAAPPR